MRELFVQRAPLLAGAGAARCKQFLGSSSGGIGTPQSSRPPLEGLNPRSYLTYLRFPTYKCLACLLGTFAYPYLPLPSTYVPEVPRSMRRPTPPAVYLPANSSSQADSIQSRGFCQSFPPPFFRLSPNPNDDPIFDLTCPPTSAV